MPNVALFDAKGKRTGEAALSDGVFGIEPKEHLVHDAVRAELANRRAGTHDTMTRGEISGGGKKPWRQKGTGRARQGSTRSPIWRHGGVVWGPHPRDYTINIPKKMKRLALLSALSDKVAQGQVVVIEDIQMEAISTKAVVTLLKSMEITGKVLLVIGEPNEILLKSSRNIAGVQLRVAPTVSVYDVLSHGTVVATRSAAARLEEAFGK